MNALRRRSPRSWSSSTRHKVPDSDAGHPRSPTAQRTLTASSQAERAGRVSGMLWRTHRRRGDQAQSAPTVRARQDINGKRPVHESGPGSSARGGLHSGIVRTCGQRRGRVPSRQAIFNSSATRPSLRSRRRSCAKGGRNTYRHSRSSPARSFADTHTLACRSEHAVVGVAGPVDRSLEGHGPQVSGGKAPTGTMLRE